MIELLKQYIGKNIYVVMVGGNVFNGVVKEFFTDKVYCKEYVVMERIVEKCLKTKYVLMVESVVGFYEVSIHRTSVK